MIGLVMILSLLSKFFSFILYVNDLTDLSGYGFTEFLINFRGGFVRRGVLGEVLMWVTAHTDIHPHVTITVICLSAFCFVLWFFLKVFKKKGYCWWIVLSPLLCGLMVFVIRKDYLLYAIIICMFLLVKDSSPAMWKKVMAFALGILALMLHEAFIFWGIPLFALILLKDRNQRFLNILMLAGLLSVFGVLCVFKGDTATAQSIIDSWNSLLPGSPLKLIYYDSIGALTWQLKDAILFHIKHNIGSSELCLGVVYWPLFYFVVYYFITFYFSVFKPQHSMYGEAERTQLSSMFLIVSVCLLPMFTVLSCDYARLFQYATVTSFASFLILNDEVKQQIIPQAVQMNVARLNNFLARLVHPSKGLLVMLLFFIGISPNYFNIYESMLQSPIGVLWIRLYSIALKLIAS